MKSKSIFIEDRKPIYRYLARSVYNLLYANNKKVPFIVIIDGTIMHYKPWEHLIFNPIVKNGWRYIFEYYYQSDSYKWLNSATAGDPILSKYATLNFFESLFREVETSAKELNLKPEEFLELLKEDMETTKDVILTKEEMRQIYKIKGALEKEATETLQDIQTMQSFSHLGMPVEELVKDPDIRAKLRNKVLVKLLFMFRRCKQAALTRKVAKVPLISGRPLGIKRMQRWSEVLDIAPLEMADDDLLMYKVAARTAIVKEKLAGIKDYVVYVDKSGSMNGEIPYESSNEQESIPKISFATAIALSLAESIKRAGAKLTLKFFDVGVHDPITNFREAIDALLKISAGSGTNITEVLQDAIENHEEEKMVIITDGIDFINEEMVKKARSVGLDITCVLIQTGNPLLEKNFKCIKINKAEPNVLVEV